MDRYDSEGRLIEAQFRSWATGALTAIHYTYQPDGVMKTRTTIEVTDAEKVTTVEEWDLPSECKKSLIAKEDIETGIVTTTIKTETFAGRTVSVTKMNAPCPS